MIKELLKVKNLDRNGLKLPNTKHQQDEIRETKFMIDRSIPKKTPRLVRPLHDSSSPLMQLTKQEINQLSTFNDCDDSLIYHPPPQQLRSIRGCQVLPEGFIQ